MSRKQNGPEGPLAREFPPGACGDSSVAHLQARPVVPALPELSRASLGACRSVGVVTDKPTKSHEFSDVDAREFYADYREQLARAEWAESRIELLRVALTEIAGPTPTSHRKTVDQLTDAVKWRQGVARDALVRDDAS